MELPGQGGEVSDRWLVMESLASPQAYKTLVDRYWRRLYSFIRRLYFLNHEDIQDVLQEAFLKAYRNLNAFDTSLSFSTWIYQITRNAAIDALRKRHRQPFMCSIDEEDVERLLVGSNELHQHISREQHEILNRVLTELPIQYREVLTLRYLEEKTYEEMVDILKKPKGTIASLVNRGRVMLVGRLKAQGLSLYGE